MLENARSAAELLKQMYESNGQDTRGVWDFLYSKPAAPPAPTEDQLALLGQALGSVLAKIGVVQDVPLTGPELLMAAKAYLDSQPAPTEPSGATELPELSKWDEVERQCVSFLEKPGIPSEAAIAWCVSLVFERREALTELRDYKAKYEAALREIAELRGIKK